MNTVNDKVTDIAAVKDHLRQQEQVEKYTIDKIRKDNPEAQQFGMVYMTSTEYSGDQIWFSGPQEMEHQLTIKDKVYIGDKDDSQLLTINIDPTIKYQTLLGIGTSLDESSIYNLSQLDAAHKEAALRMLIDPINGIGMTLFRICIGASDFTGQPFYSYYDTPPTGEPDWYNKTGKGFSIEKDIEYGIIDTIQQIITLAKEYGVSDKIKFFASIWSAPGWMKNDTFLSGYYWTLGINADGLCAGAHKPEKRSDLAMYLWRFIEEYQQRGIPIYAITLQNEPFFETAYPSCLMSGNHQAELMLELKTLFAQHDCQTKIWVWDHNFDTLDTFMQEFTSINGAFSQVDGIAFHDYSGEPSTMGQVQTQYAELNDHFTVNVTERSVWGTEGADRIIQYFRNGAISYNS